jgi:hypothetical protein
MSVTAASSMVVIVDRVTVDAGVTGSVLAEACGRYFRRLHRVRRRALVLLVESSDADASWAGPT